MIKKRPTFASFPVIGEHVAFRAGAKGRAQGVEAGVRAAAVIQAAFVQIFAGMTVSCQLGAGHPIATASVGSVGVDALTLTRAVPVPRDALVVI